MLGQFHTVIPSAKRFPSGKFREIQLKKTCGIFGAICIYFIIAELQELLNWGKTLPRESTFSCWPAWQDTWIKTECFWQYIVLQENLNRVSRNKRSIEFGLVKLAVKCSLILDIAIHLAHTEPNCSPGARTFLTWKLRQQDLPWIRQQWEQFSLYRCILQHCSSQK